MIEYNPTVIETHAQRLYRKADFIVLACMFLGLCWGVIPSMGYFARAERPLVATEWVVVGISTIAGLVIGYLFGSWLAFKYRLQAQMALCQVEIERHLKSILRANS